MSRLSTDRVSNSGGVALPGRTPSGRWRQHIKGNRSQTGPDPEASGILLLADQDTDSDVVTKVLKTAGYAGFVNVRFGVIAQ